MHERYMFLALACFAPLVFVAAVPLGVRGAVGAVPPQPLVPVRVLQLAVAASRTSSFQPWFDWLVRRLRDRHVAEEGLVARRSTAIALRRRLARASAGCADARRRARSRRESPPTAAARSRDRRRADVCARRSRLGGRCRCHRAADRTLGAARGRRPRVPLRPRGPPRRAEARAEPQRQRLPPADGALGRTARSAKGTLPLDGWYPVPLARLVVLPPLPEPSAHAHGARRLRDRDERPARLPLDHCTCCSRCGRSRVYWSARLLGWSRWVAAAAAVVSPLVVSAPATATSTASYTWQGWGVYSQLWAMWLLPLAWGSRGGPSHTGGRYAAAAAALALTIACHFITGYLARAHRRRLGARARRLVVPASGSAGRRSSSSSSLLIASWVLVPLIARHEVDDPERVLQGLDLSTTRTAPQKVLRLAVHGARCSTTGASRSSRCSSSPAPSSARLRALATRAHARSSAPSCSACSCSSAGRRWAAVLDLLPGIKDIQIHRFVIGVHLAGILLAGVGLAWILRQAFSLAASMSPARFVPLAGVIAVVAGFVVLSPAWTERAHDDAAAARLIERQRRSDATDGRDVERLAAIVKACGDGRVYAGLRATGGSSTRSETVPMHAYLADLDVDAIGFTFRTIASLSTDPEASSTRPTRRTTRCSMSATSSSRPTASRRCRRG